MQKMYIGVPENKLYDCLPKNIKESIIGRLIKYAQTKNKGSSNYPYSVTRIRAMRSKLIKKEEYMRYLNLNTDDIIKKIEELDYKKDIDELSRIYNGITLIEHSINRNTAESFQKILKITTGEIHSLLESYLKKYDIWNIKTILRGKINNIPLDQILETLITAGSMRYTFLSKISNSSLENIMNWIKNTEYGYLFDLESELNSSSLSIIENKLDKHYYNMLFKNIYCSITKDQKHFMGFIQREIDIKNIDSLLRLKKQEYQSNSSNSNINLNKHIGDIILENGLEFSVEHLKMLMSLSFKELINKLKNTSYWNKIQYLFRDDDIKNIDVKDIENELLKYNLEKTTSYSHKSVISIIPILEYIIYKTNEARNLRIILRGKSSGLSNDIIKKQLVMI